MAVFFLQAYMTIKLKVIHHQNIFESDGYCH